MSLVKALYTSAQHSLSSCVLCMGHTDNNASVNTGPKLLLFRVFKGQKKREKNGKKKTPKNKTRERKVDVLVPDFEFVRKCTFMFGESKNLLGKELK